jgi:hypothetical protein
MKVFVSILFISLSIPVFAQDVILQGKTRRQVEKAQRIATKPVIDESVTQQKVTEYPLLSVNYKTTTEVDRIEPATIKIKEQLDPLYTTYVKLGFGSKIMPLGEVYFNNTRSRKYIYGASVKHLSSWGNLPKYERSTFDRTAFNAYGGINDKRYQLLGNFNYRNQGLHYYAIQAPVDSFPKDSIRQRYNDIGFDVTFKSNAKVDTFGLNYQVGLKYNHFNTLKPKADSLKDWRGREHYIDINALVDYSLKENSYGVGLDIVHNNYRYGNRYDSISPIDTAIIRPNTLIRLKPSFKTYLWGDKFRAVVGLDLTLNIGDNKFKVHVYPNAEVRYALFDGMFIPYVGIRGGMKQNTLKSLTLENEFIRPNLKMLNENTQFDVYGGFKGSIINGLSFNIGASYAMIRNYAMFVNDTVYSHGNRFDVIFDSIKMLTIQGSMSYQLKEKLKVDVIGTYRYYDLRHNAFAWNKPDFELMTRAYYNLFDKFYVNFDFKLELGRKALMYEAGEKIMEKKGQYYTKLNPIYDFNLGFEYRYTRRLSVFLQVNNIAAQRYQRWYNAPVHSIQVLGGLTFRF